MRIRKLEIKFRLNISKKKKKKYLNFKGLLGEEAKGARLWKEGVPDV